MDIPQFISTLVGGHLGSTMDILMCPLADTGTHFYCVYIQSWSAGEQGMHMFCICIYCKELLKVTIPNSTPTRSISEFQLLPIAS